MRVGLGNGDLPLRRRRTGDWGYRFVLVHEKDDDQEVGLVGLLARPFYDGGREMGMLATERRGILRPAEGDKRACREVSQRGRAWTASARASKKRETYGLLLLLTSVRSRSNSRETERYG
jgi:hypothetical protein